MNNDRDGNAEKNLPQMWSRSNADSTGLLRRTKTRDQGLSEMSEMRT